MLRKYRQSFLRHGGIPGLIGDISIYIIMFFVSVVTLYPFLNLLAISFNDALDTVKGGIGIWPRVFTTFNYENVFENPNIVQAAIMSVTRTVVGSFTTIIACMCVAYAVSRKEFALRFIFLKALTFTMYISGGLVPFFLLIRLLGLLNTFWVYILPAMVSAWNIIIIRSYIENSISDSIIESARIDGASEFRILFTIVFPLAVPVIAVVTLWTAVGQWNSWFDAMLFNNTAQHLSTLQYELQKILVQSLQLQSVDPNLIAQAGQAAARQTVTPQAVRATMTIVAAAPIILIYPFIQRYFIHGLTIGGVKE